MVSYVEVNRALSSTVAITRANGIHVRGSQGNEPSSRKGLDQNLSGTKFRLM